MTMGTETVVPVIAEPLLLRKEEGRIGSGLLAEVGLRFARSLQKQLHDLGANGVQVVAEPHAVQPFDQWRQGPELSALLTFDIAAMRDRTEMFVSHGTIVHLVDLFYGGPGTIGAPRAQWSAAELRFVERFGAKLAHLLEEAWRPTAAVTALCRGVTLQPPPIAAAARSKEHFCQMFQITKGNKAVGTLRWAYAVADVDHLLASVIDTGQPAATTADTAWATSLHQALGQVHLPVRSVLARPDISLGKMLSLSVGDIIPLAMPEHVPLNIGGYGLGAGTIGEANGRIAIRLEKIATRASL